MWGDKSAMVNARYYHNRFGGGYYRGSVFRHRGAVAGGDVATGADGQRTGGGSGVLRGH